MSKLVAPLPATHATPLAEWRDPVSPGWFLLNAGRRRRWRDKTAWLAVSLLLAVAAAEALAILSLDYHDFFQDDSYISLRYSQRLLDGLGLTWTDGERVEGYSNFLWVVLVAGAGAVGRALGQDLVVVARMLGVLLAGSVPFAILRAYAPGRIRELLAPLTAIGFIVFSGPIQAYAVGGLEQALLAAEMGWLLCLAYPLLEQPEPRPRTWSAVGAVLGAIVLTRPDGAILVAGAGAGLVLARGCRLSALRLGAKVAIVPAGCFVGQLLFRRLYYHDWFPNTYYAKVSWTHERLDQGLTYIAKTAPPNSMLVLAVLLVVVVAFWDKTARRRAVFGLTMVVPWLVYLAGVGGDLFSEHRHMVPVLCIFAVLAAEGVRGLAEWGRGPAVLAALASFTSLATYARDNEHDPEKDRALHDTFHVGGITTGPMLRMAFSELRPLLAVDAAGCMPYYYELPCLDMLGLNDRYLAHHRPKDIGTGLVGHELGDGAYVLDRQPDIVSFGGPTGAKQPVWRGGWEMAKDARFAKQYKLVHVKSRWPEELDSYFFFRLEGRAGIRRDSLGMSVPGYLLYVDGTVARPDGQNHVVLEIEGSKAARIADLSLPAGRVVVSVDATGAVAGTLAWSGGAHSATFSEPVEVDLGPEAVSASLSVQARDGGSVKIRAIRFDARGP